MDGPDAPSSTTTAPSTVLIIGCGDLGTEAGLRFAAAGHRVVGWRRSPQLLPAPIEGVAADLTRELPTVPADTGIVILTAAADGRTPEAYRAAYSGAVEALLHALKRDGVRPNRVLLVSSTAVYGNNDGRAVDETTPAEPATETGRILREAEQLLLTALPSATVLRLAGIYGPGRTRLIDQVRDGTVTVPQNSRITNRIHRDDAAAAIVHLTTAVVEPAQLYVGVDDLPVELSEVLEFLAARLGRELPPPSDVHSSRGGNKVCSNARLKASGFALTYPSYREGYEAVMDGQGQRHG